MQTFKTVNDIEAWLDGLSYEAFWQEIIPHAVRLPGKSECDDRIKRRILSEADIFEDLKRTAVLEISQRYNLKWEDQSPYMFCRSDS